MYKHMPVNTLLFKISFNFLKMFYCTLIKLDLLTELII